MAAFGEGKDLGPIIVTVVVVTLVVGGVLYVWNRYEKVQTAFNLPVIERTVPTIVPNQPQF